MPLAYMLRLMRDGTIDPKRRDQMATRALPFTAVRNAQTVVPQPRERIVSKKIAAERAAQTAAAGTDWADLVDGEKAN
jgi:hypothetical protein